MNGAVVKAVFRKEIRASVYSLRFAVGTAFAFLLFLAAAAVLASDYNTRLSDYNSAAIRHRGAVGEAKVFSELYLEVDRPPAPLSLICLGVDRSLPTSSGFSLLEPPTTDGAGAARNPLLAVFPTLDVAAVIEVVLSLLAVLLSYDAVSGERERGTLALMLSNSAPRNAVLLGKYLAAMALLAPLVLSGLAASVLIFVVSCHSALGIEEALALLIAFAGALAYLSLVTLTGFAISARSRRSSTSLTACLLAWVVFVLVLPEAASSVAAAIRPLPSGQKTAQEEAAVASRGYQRLLDVSKGQRIPLDEQRFNIGRRALISGDVPILRRLDFGSAEYVQWALDGARNGLPVLLETASQLQASRERTTRAMFAQADLAESLRRLSPASLFYDTMAAVADTDRGRYQRFLDGVRSQRERLLDAAKGRHGLDYRFFTHDGALTAPSFAALAALEKNGERQQLDAIRSVRLQDLPSIRLDVPEFRLPDRPASGRLDDAALSLASLLLANMGVGLAAALLFSRTDVRVG